MATLGQANKGHWIGVSTAEETGAKFFDGKGNCSWSAMLRCRQKFAKRLVGQPWREFVKGESTLLDGVNTETEHSKQSFGQLYRAIFKGDVRAQHQGTSLVVSEWCAGPCMLATCWLACSYSASVSSSIFSPWGRKYYC